VIALKFLSKPINTLWFWIVFIIGMAGFSFFFLLPFVMGIYYSTVDLLDDNRFVGFTHYAALFNNELFRTALANTVRFTFLSLGLMFVVSFGAAYGLHFTRIGRSIPRSLLYLPLTVPAVSISFAWLWLFHYRGYISSMSHVLFGVNLNMLSGTSLYIPLLSLYIWKYAGFNILIYLAGLSRLPSENLDAFFMESKNRLRLVQMVLLPHERPRTFYMLLLNLIFSMGIFREIFAVWTHYPPRQLYMVQHFVYNNFIRLNYERAAAGAVILAIFILFILSGLLVWEKRRVHE
jgi:multiple sugar transport system permease protein